MGRHRRTRREKNLKKDEYTGEWIVYKVFKKIGYHEYGKFKTFREAKKYRNYLDQNNNWFDELPDYKKIKAKKRGTHYYMEGNYFVVSKQIRYITRWFGAYKKEEDAKKIVRELILNDWDWDKLPDNLKNLRVPDEKINPTYIPCNRFKLVKKYTNPKTKSTRLISEYFANLEDAIRVIDWLDDHNGKKEELPNELYNLRIETEIPKFYYKNSSGSYHVCKHMDGEIVGFGNYPDEETAKLVVNELKKCDWKIDRCKIDLEELRIKRPTNSKCKLHEKPWDVECHS